MESKFEVQNYHKDMTNTCILRARPAGYLHHENAQVIVKNTLKTKRESKKILQKKQGNYRNQITNTTRANKLKILLIK